MAFLRNITVLVLLTGLVCAPALLADGRGASAKTIYVVDMQGAIDRSTAGQTAKARIDSEVKKEQAGLDKLRAEVDRLKADLMKQSSLLSAEAADEKRGQVEQKTRDLERAVEDSRQNVQRKTSSEIETIVREIDKIVSEISTQGGYQVVLEKDPRLVLFIADQFDLTSQVVKKLNERKLNME